MKIGLIAVVAAASASLAGAGRVLLWGETGHRIIGRVAAEAVPADMPAFFRAAAPQLEYLNPEPDRWRSRDEMLADPALNDATQYDHYLNWEWIKGDALKAPNRFAFLDSVRMSGGQVPRVGLLPYRIVELSQRLRVEFRLWRASTNESERRVIEQRIIDDAGILGHYVADGANPHHVTIHNNAWVGENPNGFTTVPGFHSRYESVYVQAQLSLGDVKPLATHAPRMIDNLRQGVIGYLGRSRDLVPRLYELDKLEAFSATNTNSQHKRFTAERLAAGAEMLRDLWYTAWVTSAMPVQKDR